jgi:hypothetical protein
VIDWLFVIKRLPEASPMAEGVNPAMKVALCPTAIVKGSSGPVTVKPRPDATAWVIVKGAAPEFLRVRL